MQFGDLTDLENLARTDDSKSYYDGRERRMWLSRIINAGSGRHLSLVEKITFFYGGRVLDKILQEFESGSDLEYLAWLEATERYGFEGALSFLDQSLRNTVDEP